MKTTLTAALAILAFAAASPAFAQLGGSGDDLLIGGQTSHQTAPTGGGTVSDDVIVDGRIITGENPASAGARPFDPQFTGGVFVGGDAKEGPGGLKGKTAKTNANAAPYRGGVKVAVGDVDGGSSQTGKGGSRHTGGVNVMMGDGSVRSGGGKGAVGKIAGATPQANAGDQPPPPPPPPPSPSNGGASPLPVLLVIANRDFYDQAAPGLTADQPAGGGAKSGLGDGSVRGIGTGLGSGNAPKTGALGSLSGLGSIGQLATPPGAPPAQAQNNLKQLGLALHNNNDSRDGGDGDGIITGSGTLAMNVKTFNGQAGGPAKGATHVKAFDASRTTGPKVGGAPQVKTFDGNARAASVGGAVATFTLDKQGKSTK